MFSLAHLSDIHLAPLPLVRKRDLISKRLTGYTNWTLNRKKALGNNALASLIADIKAHNPDHVAITGDLVNLALQAEFDATRLWLENFAPIEKISVVPGNHDAYVPGALLNAHRAWGRYMPVNAESPKNVESLDDGFPFVRHIGPVAIIGVSSAVASAPFLSTGRFRKSQSDRLRLILAQSAERGLFRVVLIHHPPFRYGGDAAKRLYGIRLFQHVIKEVGAELILHGHTHIPSFQMLGIGNRVIPVIGVPSASQSHGSEKPPAAWNQFSISGSADLWNCQWNQRGIQSDGTVAQVSSRQLWSNGQAVSASATMN